MTIIKKTMAVAMIAGAALAVSACGKTENTSMTDMNAMAPTEGSMNDMSASENAGDNSMMGSNSSNMM